MKIPKVLHFIWIGDESQRPENCINTWRSHHPEWQVKIWGNSSLADRGWLNSKHMIDMWPRELNGVADMMRWEILYNEGGVVLDADSICLRPLDEEFLENESFCCWENETAAPGLIAAGYFGCCPQNSFVGEIILDIHNDKSVIWDEAWKTVGPLRLTVCYHKFNHTGLKIYPSHYFIPEHHTGLKYTGLGPVYAMQLWGSTKGTIGYELIHKSDLDLIVKKNNQNYKSSNI